MKMKEIGQRGGVRPWGPLGSANAVVQSAKRCAKNSVSELGRVDLLKGIGQDINRQTNLPILTFLQALQKNFVDHFSLERFSLYAG